MSGCASSGTEGARTAAPAVPRAPAAAHGRRHLWVAAAVLVTAAILIACFLPNVEVPGPPDVPLDKVFHLLAFAAFTFAWRRAGTVQWGTLLAAVLLAALTEVGQALFVPTRTGDVMDAAADLAGALLGLLLARRPPP